MEKGIDRYCSTERKCAAVERGITMDLERLNAIKDRVAKAAPGPWQYDEEERGIWNKDGFNYLGTVTLSHNDAEFIAHNREDVPALIAELERLKNQPIIKHICNASFVGEYPLSAILETEKTLAEGSMFTVKGTEYMVLNIMVRSATELIVETTRTLRKDIAQEG